jgi:hypothetical protein
MNERIRQLEVQAGMQYRLGPVVNIAKDGTHTFEEEKVYDTFNPEKFAELIVRECMKESMDEIVADEDIAQEKDPLIREYLTGNNQGIVDAVVRFRNHFGIEE